MGLLKLLISPVTGPLWVINRVVAEGDRQYHDPEAIRAELALLAQQLELNQISEQEFAKQEEQLLERLMSSRRKP